MLEHCGRALIQLWNRMWFQSRNTLPLEIVRIGVALSMLLAYAGITPELYKLYSNQGWLQVQDLSPLAEQPWRFSLLFYLDDSWLGAFHAVFLVAIVALLMGWRVSVFKWLVLIGHLSYVQRNPAITYGVDSSLSSLLLILCLAPIGSCLSLDRVRQVRLAKKQDLGSLPTPEPSAWGFACTRLIQIQMAILYLFSAIEKLRGETWWSGDALWIALTNFEFTNIPIGWLAEQYWLVNLMTYAVLVIEMGYFFLIWGQRTRPWFLALALLLHLGIGVMMGLYFFAAVMIAGHLSFIRHDWLARLGQWWRQRMGAMEMIYDGDCGFCKRSMASFLAFDGLGQITVRNFRHDPSPVVSDEALEVALYLVTDKGEQLPGFEAYRYAVLRVPGMWWMLPFFYVPFFSRALGTPFYLWIARNRGRLSKVLFTH